MQLNRNENEFPLELKVGGGGGGGGGGGDKKKKKKRMKGSNFEIIEDQLLIKGHCHTFQLCRGR